MDKLACYKAGGIDVLKTTIAQVGKYVDKEVTIGAWIANKRSSGKIAFFTAS